MTTAIDKYVYVVVKERFDNQIYVSYSKKEIVSRVEELEHELVREAMKIVGVQGGIEIAFLSDIPAAGSGLGSSSSVSVGVLNALYQYVGKAVDSKTLAEQACEIELKRLHKPIGVQDQYIAALGGVQYLSFSNEGVTSERINLSEEQLDDLKNYLMLFYTGRTRQSDSILKEQRSNIKDQRDTLIVMSQMARAGKELLEKGQLVKLGKLLDEGWALKKKLASKISDSQIDMMYKAAKRAGAIGGKISGAGGGGFLTLFVPTNRRETVRSAMNGAREMPISLSRDGSKVIFNIRK